jgi:hypothetical protein
MIERKRLAGGTAFILHHGKPFKLKLSIPDRKIVFLLILSEL